MVSQEGASHERRAGRPGAIMRPGPERASRRVRPVGRLGGSLLRRLTFAFNALPFPTKRWLHSGKNAACARGMGNAILTVLSVSYTCLSKLSTGLLETSLGNRAIWLILHRCLPVLPRIQ